MPDKRDIIGTDASSFEELVARSSARLAALARRHLAGVGAACVAALVVAGLAVWLAVGSASPGARPTGTGREASGAAVPLPGHRTAPPCAGHCGPSAASGTAVRRCASANWGGLARHWRAESLRVGTLWFVYGLPSGFGYVRLARSAGHLPHYHHDNRTRLGTMIVEVDDGSRAVLKVAPAGRPYFAFLSAFRGPPYRLRDGVTSLRLAGCPRGTTGPNGPVTDYYLGFLIKGGHDVPVDVQTPAARRAARVIFMCPGRACGA